MKRLLAIFTLALILCIVRPLYAQQGVVESDPFDIVIPNAITSSVSIVMVDQSNGLGICSGVVIKNTPEESIILTAKHCLVFEGEIYIESFLVDHVGISYRSDLAYLILNKFIPYKTPARISNYIPKSKDKIVGIGYPSTKLYITKGTIFLQTPKEQYAWLEIKKGLSGGGVFNTDGELVGIMIRYYPGVQMGILVRLEDIYTLINVNKLLEE